MSNLIENAVAVKDLAAVLKKPAAATEAEAVRLQMFIGTDWRGEPAVAVIDAAALVSGQAARDLENTELNRSLAAQADEWTIERERVVRAAQVKAMGGHETPEGRQRASEAGAHAGAEFEATCPPEILPRVSMIYGTRSLVGKLRDRVSGLTGGSVA